MTNPSDEKGIQRALEAIPDWSTFEGMRSPADVSAVGVAIAGLMKLSPEDRHAAIVTYSARWCYLILNLARASSIYVFMRIVFELPQSVPREQAKAFGGWLHPSINSGTPNFKLSWPVHFDREVNIFSISRFPGYFARGYDAANEFGFFSGLYGYRPAHVVARSRFQACDTDQD